MPLYEVILEKSEGQDELRFTDHELSPNRPLVIGGGTLWQVDRIEAPTHPLATHRYVCVPVDRDAA